MGAVQWAAIHKRDSEASQNVSLVVMQLHLCNKIEVVDTTNKAGVNMGDLDTMSRIIDDENSIAHPLKPTLLATVGA